MSPKRVTARQATGIHLYATGAAKSRKSAAIEASDSGNPDPIRHGRNRKQREQISPERRESRLADPPGQPTKAGSPRRSHDELGFDAVI